MLALFRGEVFQAAAYQRHDGVLDQITAFLCLLLLLLVYSSDNQMVRLMTIICIIRIDVESLKTFQLRMQPTPHTHRIKGKSYLLNFRQNYILVEQKGMVFTF